MAIDAETFKNLTKKQKLVLSGLLVVLFCSAFIWFVFIPKNNEIVRLEREIAALNNDINVHRIKVRRLAQLKRENRILKAQLKGLQEQLPPEAEVALLLKQVSEIGGRSGLDFKLWRPGPRVVSDSALYIEIPVNIEVAGSYHSVGVFFDKIGKLKRIINVSNIQMSAPKMQRGRVTIQTRFSATAFASVEKDRQAALSPGKGS